MKKKTAVPTLKFWLLLILLLAAGFRLYAITDVPPGLTHDEADHGITAWAIVNGLRAIYFTIGYGREPLYDYATAGMMALLGPTYLAARLTAVFASLILIAGMFAWVRRAFGESTALLTAAGLAVGFWPVMAGRQALRSITLPALFTLAVYFAWRGFRAAPSARRYFITAGVLLGLTFYTYIPSRVMWGVFPVLLVYAAWRQRPFLRRNWRGVLLMLLVAGLVGAPLFAYLATHPAAEARIRDLSSPLTAAAGGDRSLLWANVRAGLGLFTGNGDTAWRYNLPGRPLLWPVIGALFYLGGGALLWRAVRGRPEREARAGFLALAWLLAGLSPVLVTGPDLSMTQAMGMQPVVFLLPAVGLVTVGRWADRRLGKSGQRVVWTAAVAVYGVTAVFTARDYFGRWANAPQVRVQYEATMMAALDYIDRHDTGVTAVSTITPAPVHSPAVAQMVLGADAVDLRWFDARRSLLLPQADAAIVIVPGFTPPSPYLGDIWVTAKPIESLSLRATDLDRPLDVYQVEWEAAQQAWTQQFTQNKTAVFGETAIFLGYDLQTPMVAAGETARLVTWWQVERPLPGAILFTHLLGSDGVPIAQADRLDAPGALWQAGDQFVQLHEFTVPAETAGGDYPLAVGVYTCPEAIPCPDGQRLPVSQKNEPTGESLILTTLTVAP